MTTTNVTTATGKLIISNDAYTGITTMAELPYIRNEKIKNITVSTDQLQTVVKVPVEFHRAFRKGLVTVHHSAYAVKSSDTLRAYVVGIRMNKEECTITIDLPISSEYEIHLTLMDISQSSDFEPKIIIR